MTDTATTLTYDGTLPDGVLIESETNPWVEIDGEPVDWTTTKLPRTDCPCEENGSVVLPGVLDGMDSPDGVQRCDACGTFDGDLDAALALARLVGGVVKFTPAGE